MSKQKRNIPSLTAVPTFSGTSSTSMSQTYTVKLVTPMFGGGTEAGRIDDQMPIRVSSIRGHLRFWWRLLCGQTNIDNSSLSHALIMSLREAEIFGNTEIPSLFMASVTVTQSTIQSLWDSKTQPYGFDRFGSEMYALFPTIQDHNNRIPKVMAGGLKFQLKISWQNQRNIDAVKKAENDRRAQLSRQLGQPVPEWTATIEQMQEQFQKALWGWLNFGGIGSRTRRGVGAVSCEHETLTLLSGNELRFPFLDPVVTLFGSASDNAMSAWARGLSIYREFRQGTRSLGQEKQVLEFRKDPVSKRDTLRVKNVRPPTGRTSWPEPDSLRSSEFTGCSLKTPSPWPATCPPHTILPHNKPVDLNVALPAFPRAILGMPINFQFADGPTKETRAAGISNRDRDPDKVEIVPADSDRMASPVIIRPVVVGKQWYAAFIFLNDADGMLRIGLNAVVRGPGMPANSQVPVSVAQIAGDAMKTVCPLNGHSDAIAALKEKLTNSVNKYESLPPKNSGGQR